jgi:hypothetical protein
MRSNASLSAVLVEDAVVNAEPVPDPLTRSASSRLGS